MIIYCEGACYVPPEHRRKFAEKGLVAARYAYSVYYFGNNSLQPDRCVMSELLTGDNNHAEFMGVVTVYRKYKYVHHIYSDWHAIPDIYLPEDFEWFGEYKPIRELNKRGKTPLVSSLIEKCQLDNFDLLCLKNLTVKLPTDEQCLHHRRHHELHKLLRNQGKKDQIEFNQIIKRNKWK